MVSITFEAHGTTTDNEADLSSGHFDVDLSELGEKQAKELGERYINNDFDAIFTSDLKRSYRSAEIAFGDRKIPIIKDPRLRECDYGDLERHPSPEVDQEKIDHISKPFPNGQSYTQTTSLMRQFLQSLLKMYEGKKVLIIGHRATQYGLENLINDVPLESLVKTQFKWQPGWTYRLKSIK